MRVFAFYIVLISVLAFNPLRLFAQNTNDEYAPVRVYDPSRNAAQDVQAAEQEAQRTGRNVLVDVGGNWCIWCHNMDRFFDTHPEVAALRDKYYVTVFVNFSPENRNQKFLSQFPRIPGFPHLFVLDPSGKLVRSQFTGALEQGDSYSVEKMRMFLERYAPGEHEKPSRPEDKGGRSPSGRIAAAMLR